MDSPGDRLTQLADEARGLATAGLHYGADPYDRDRYERLLTIAAELLALADPREASQIEAAFRGALGGLGSPPVAAGAAIFDESGRLLLTRRADNGRWCVPGGAAEIGDSPSDVAVRETYEETGLRVKPVALIGVYDSRRHARAARIQHYSMLFAAERTGGELAETHEVTAFAWVTKPEALAMNLNASTRRKIPDAFTWYVERAPAVFD